jgi:hypothetical protein
MENNIINLSLKDYLELRDFKKSILEKNCMKAYNVTDNNYISLFPLTYISIEKAMEEITKANNDLQKLLSERNDELRILKLGIDVEIENRIKEKIKEIKKFSIFKFIRWRKNKNL